MFIFVTTNMPTLLWTGSKLVALVNVAHVAAAEACGAPVRELNATDYSIMVNLLNG